MSASITLVILVRHGTNDAIGHRLVGRLPRIHLNDAGLRQAQRLVERLRDQPIDGIYASPLDRALETAAPLAAARGLAVQRLDDLIEVDFGAWTGLTFEELSKLPAWSRFNAQRSSADVPGGERAPAVQARVVRALDELRARHEGQALVAFSHSDVIRAAVMYAAGAPLDLCHRIDITPASISALALSWDGPRVLYVNDRDRDYRTTPP